SASGANKYRGLVLKKKPLISQDPKRTWFDSADWALHKQEASPDKRTIAGIENLKPKYFQRTPSKELPPTFAYGQENQVRNYYCICKHDLYSRVTEKKYFNLQTDSSV
ncbi:hypothetical protein F2Q68_00030542, partial [Brassica cretica]